jgi:hypothetical protein
MRLQEAVFTGLVKLQDQLPRDGHLLLDVSNISGAPAGEFPGGRLHSEHEALEWIAMRDRLPRLGHGVLETIKA